MFLYLLNELYRISVYLLYALCRMCGIQGFTGCKYGDFVVFAFHLKLTFFNNSKLNLNMYYVLLPFAQFMCHGVCAT